MAKAIAKNTAARRRSKFSRPKGPNWHRWGGLRYNVNGDGMSPFCVGLAAAEFMPADPEKWLEAALDAGVNFARWENDVLVEEEDAGNAGKFLIGLLFGTPNGREALADFLDARGIKGAALSASKGAGKISRKH